MGPDSWSGGTPVLVWIHGGSYTSGGASDPAIDGSNLAQSTGSIVVVVQYRLGILGYLPPSAFSANKNLGVMDVIAALQWIQNTIECVGGDKDTVTLAGQSSGGNLIRNLLATPSASNLFARGILESDPVVCGLYHSLWTRTHFVLRTTASSLRRPSPSFNPLTTATLAAAPA
jgi:carboxylesterase type B